MSAETRKIDAEWWREVAKRREEMGPDVHVIGLCSECQAGRVAERIRHRLQLRRVFQPEGDPVYWWRAGTWECVDDPIALNERILACCFLAAMLDAGDLE